MQTRVGEGERGRWLERTRIQNPTPNSHHPQAVPMGVYEGGAQLSKALRQLMGRWEETRAAWDDAQARELEEKYLIPLQMDLRNTITAMAHVAAMLEKIKRECT
jgi:hypothetical protein